MIILLIGHHCVEYVRFGCVNSKYLFQLVLGLSFMKQLNFRMNIMNKAKSRY